MKKLNFSQPFRKNVPCISAKYLASQNLIIYVKCWNFLQHLILCIFFNCTNNNKFSYSLAFPNRLGKERKGKRKEEISSNFPLISLFCILLDSTWVADKPEQKRGACPEIVHKVEKIYIF
jgi:hypothetical protein